MAAREYDNSAGPAGNLGGRIGWKRFALARLGSLANFFTHPRGSTFRVKGQLERQTPSSSIKAPNQAVLTVNSIKAPNEAGLWLDNSMRYDPII